MVIIVVENIVAQCLDNDYSKQYGVRSCNSALLHNYTIQLNNAVVCDNWLSFIGENVFVGGDAENQITQGTRSGDDNCTAFEPT